MNQTPNQPKHAVNATNMISIYYRNLQSKKLFTNN